MVELLHMPRRKAIKLLSTAMIAVPTVGFSNQLSPAKMRSKPLQVNIFSKHLQFLDFTEMVNVVRELGFSGIDLTVRKGGHVEPERVEEELPAVTEVMKSYGIEPYIITTNVLDAKSVIDKNTVSTAADLGYNLYRTGWLNYPTDSAIDKTLEQCKTQFADLALLNQTLNIAGSYQNHSGNYMGSALWDLAEVLDGIPPSQLGSQYDIMHATVDGGTNWETGFRMIKGKINSLAIKDFKWGKVDGQWKPIKTPLGQGMVDIRRFLTMIKDSAIELPMTMHFEYELGGAEHGARNLTVDSKHVFSQMKKDLSYLQNIWKSINS